MKRIVMLVCILALLGCAVCSAAKPTKHVYFFYKIQDEFLEIQDDGGNLKKGTEAFEKILKDSMKERFVVDGIKRVPYNTNPTATEYLKQVKDSQLPYIRVVKVTGYQQALQNRGVGANGKKLPITISCEDFIADRTDKKLYGVPSGYDYFNSPMIKDDVKLASAADVKRVTKEKLNEAMYDIAVPPSKYIEQKKFPDVYNSYVKVFNGDFKSINNSVPDLKAGDSKSTKTTKTTKSSKATKADTKKSSKASKAEQERLKAEEKAKEKLAKQKAQQAKAEASKAAASASKPAVSASKPAASASKPAASASKPAASASKPAVSASKPAASASKPATTGKVVVSNKPTRKA